MQKLPVLLQALYCCFQIRSAAPHSGGDNSLNDAALGQPILSKFRASFTPVFALLSALITAGCGALDQVVSDGWNQNAKNSIKSVRESLDIKSGNYPTMERVAAAMQRMEPVIAHPEAMKLQIRQDFSFDATPPVQTSVGPGDIILTLRQIAYSYELVGAWQKAGEVVVKALVFSADFGKSHLASDRSERFDFGLTGADYVALYREYARCLERSGRRNDSRNSSQIALSKLNTMANSVKTAGKLTGWQAGVAESNRRTYADEYDRLGIIGLERGDPASEVEPLFKRSIELWQAGGKPSEMQAESMQHLALALLEEKHPADAEHYSGAALEIMQSPNGWASADHIVDAAGVLARCYWLEGKQQQAILILQTPLEKYVGSRQASAAVAKGWLELACYLNSTGDRKAAEQALQIANEKSVRFEEYAAGLRQSGIIYLADATDRQAAKIRSDLKALTPEVKIEPESLQSLKPDFPLFEPPSPIPMGPVYTK